jgi:hypothetical protein
MVLKLRNIFESPYYWHDFKIKLGGLICLPECASLLAAGGLIR